MSVQRCGGFGRAALQTPRLALALLGLTLFACGDEPELAPVDGDGQTRDESTRSEENDNNEDDVELVGDDEGADQRADAATRSDDEDDNIDERSPAQPGTADSGATTAPLDGGVVVPEQGETLADGAVQTAQDGAAEPLAPAVDHGEGDGKDVVTIGDSWMSMIGNGDGIEGALRRAGKDYRNYGVPGTTLAGSIPGQYTSAKRGGDIATVIMTGGGNDIMFSGACNSSADSCGDAAAQIVERLNTLWTQMANDGVKDVVYIQYASSAGTARMRPDEGASSSGESPVEICKSGEIRCHSIPTSDLVSARDLPDGIHPNRAANDRIAARILEKLEERGVRR